MMKNPQMYSRRMQGSMKRLNNVNYSASVTYALQALGAVSYTHLDVYKRQVFIRLAEMFVSEETVVCGKRRRVCGCQYQVFVAIDKSTFSLCISLSLIHI